ncbi:hypothetical protein EV421DRAFT_2018899 [Armillaria borealis]|uniref:Uncharacterized protein n=1 Tax=Armillaria borealis TaxID=47425 RepID=A0AA39JK89_9AGAR|nr:hypothetical protein EV421DRAFT_2018899 [Armillaria borealis]
MKTSYSSRRGLVYAKYFGRTNTVIFETNISARKDRKSQTARFYPSAVAQHCPHRAGEAVIKKIEFMKSSRVPNHEFLLCYVRDRRNIYDREAVIRIERFSDSAPPQPPLEPHVNISALSLQPPVKDRRSLSSESISGTSSHSSSPSLFGPALDLFTITYMPVIAVKDYDVLSTLTFNDNSTFSAEEAVVIAMVASDAADECSVLSHQCYWYAREKEGPLRREEAARRVAEAVAERERQEKLEAQQREEAAFQRGESLLRTLQGKDEELARKQKELDDYKRD